MRLTLALATVLLAASPARAEVYLGGAVLSSSYEYEDVSPGTGSKVFLGYRIDGFPMMFEVAHVDLGKPQVDNLSQGGLTLKDATLGFTGNNFSVGYFGSQPNIRLGYWGKVGFYDGTSKLRGTGSSGSGTQSFDLSEKTSGLSWGLGVQYMFTPWFGAMLDLEALNNITDVPGTDSKSTVTTFSGGLVLAFPPFRQSGKPTGHHEAKPRPMPRPAPVPVETTPAPVEPAPVPADTTP